MTLSEKEILLLVSNARSHDRIAWDSLLKRFQVPLHAYCSELLSDRQEALDIVQKSFIKATRHLPSLREDSKFGGWLFGIARQECIDSIRRRGRQQTAFSKLKFEELEFSSCPGEALGQEDDARRARALVRELDADLREPITLYYLEEFSLSQIAEIMKIPSGTVKSRLHRARKILKIKMEKTNEPA